TNRPLPPGFEPCEAEPDPATGHYPGWVPVGEGPEDRWFREATCSVRAVDGRYAVLGRPYGEPGVAPDGTYELCGPKVQGNPDGFWSHVLVPHGKTVLSDCPRAFEGLRDYLAGRDIEGIVWHHRDGRMCKLKGKDFGHKRPR